MAFVRAERKRAKARIGICGPAGSGKTKSALRIAFGIVGYNGKIAVIDTEHGSASLYADLGSYDTDEMDAPFTVQKYIAKIREAEKLGYDLIIVDSLTHAWAGSGGLLEFVDQKNGNGGNKFAGWREATPLHNELVEAMLQSPLHVIATMRSKTEYILEEDARGKKVPKKMGLAPVQRDGMDYEFTLVFDVDQGDHRATASKDRTGLFKNITQAFNDTLTEEEGKLIKTWLETGIEAPAPPPRSAQEPPPHQPELPGSSAGNSPTQLFINREQFKVVKDLIIDTRSDEKIFLEVFRIASLDKLPAAQYNNAVKALEKKKQQNASSEGAAAGNSQASASQGTASPGMVQGIKETLAARNIPFEEKDGTLLAKPPFSDGAAREYLKSLGFTWDSSGKAWRHAA